jgi:chromate transport protein ChrA
MFESLFLAWIVVVYVALPSSVAFHVGCRAPKLRDDLVAVASFCATTLIYAPAFMYLLSKYGGLPDVRAVTMGGILALATSVFFETCGHIWWGISERKTTS